jgi:hypothetical protein
LSTRAPRHGFESNQPIFQQPRSQLLEKIKIPKSTIINRPSKRRARWEELMNHDNSSNSRSQAFSNWLLGRPKLDSVGRTTSVAVATPWRWV